MDIDRVILKELETADYFVFVDFPREKLDGGEYRGSLFCHQELAVAHYLGFAEHVILIRHPQVRLEGLLKYLLANDLVENKQCFDDPQHLVEEVARLATKKGWKPDFSRHLVPVRPIGRSPLVWYRDHRWQGLCYTWNVTMRNCTLRQTADRVVARLTQVESNGEQVNYRDWTWLKWAGMWECYETMIPPGEQIGFAAFAAPVQIRCGRPTSRLTGNVRLLSRADIDIPDILENHGPGEYRLTYRVESLNFPRCDVKVRLVLGGDVATTSAEIET